MFFNTPRTARRRGAAALSGRPSAVGLALIALAFGAPAGGSAQESPTRLTLDEAVEIAIENSPTFLSQRNDVHNADWALRQAYGALLPSSSASLGFQYEAKGNVRFGSLTGSDIGVSETPAQYFSDYSVGLGYHLDAATVATVGLRRALRHSAQQRVDAAQLALASQITTQYLNALRERDNVQLAEREVTQAQQNLDLAQARADVGTATSLQAKQAEVELGRARVGLLTAQNQYLAQRLELLRQMGVELNRDVELTSEFAVFEPTWDADSLVERALRSHPELIALRAEREAGQAGVRAARFTYLPSLDVQAGWSGYTRQVANENALITQAQQQSLNQIQSCQQANDLGSRLNPPLPPTDCSQFAFTDATRSAILAQNNVFPFDFSKQPFSASARITLPIFNGFAREQQIENARVAADDARYALRAEELKLRADIVTALNTLETAYRTVQLEQRNSQLAAEQFELSQERYRLGAISFVELTEATTLRARADQAYVASVYSFHQALAALEAAVGTNLVDQGEAQ